MVLMVLPCFLQFGGGKERAFLWEVECAAPRSARGLGWVTEGWDVTVKAVGSPLAAVRLELLKAWR